MKTAKCNPPPSLLPFPVAPRLALCKNIQDNKKVEDCAKLNCVAPQRCSDDNRECVSPTTPCGSLTCLNYATCNTSTNKCVCATGYSGETCDTLTPVDCVVCT